MFFLPILTVFAAIALLILAFEIWMLVEAATNKNISPEEKLLWIVGIFFIHPFVAIAYFFVRYNNKPIN